MFGKEYKICYKACTESPRYEDDGFKLYRVAMTTHRLYVDDRDIMNDTWYPNWVAEDDFIVTIKNIRWDKHGTRATPIAIAEYEVYTTDPNFVNRIYYNVKHGTEFWDIIRALQSMDDVTIKRKQL